MKYLKIFENWKYDDNNKELNSLIENARKWSEKDFIEEYVDRNDINYALDVNGKVTQYIKKGDHITLARKKRDDSGKMVYSDGFAQNIPYKKVIADKDYNSDIWGFIMNHTDQLQEEARNIYHKNKDNKKPDFKKGSTTIKAYHASPFKFKQFKYQEESISSQIGADVGFFFFLDKKNVDYYASVLKDNHGQSYIYTVEVQIGDQLELNGEDIGTNWGRQGELSQAEIEGHDTVLVHDADTGYGITDELVVFDDDNIKILNIQSL